MTETDRPITGADERIRPVEDPSPSWSDAVSFSAWDDDTGLFLLARLAVLPNRPAATGAVLAWVGGRPVYAYGHALDEVPLADWDDLAIAGLRCQELDALREWEVNLDDGDHGLSLRFEGLSGAVAYPRLLRAVAHGHYEQSCRVTGQVDVGGHLVRVDGVGQRSHTWGVRDPAAVAGWHASTGFLGPSSRRRGEAATARTFHLWEVTGLDGVVTGHGYVHDGGEDLPVESLEGSVGSGSEPFVVVATVRGGRRFTVRGTPHGVDVPVRPAGAGEGSEIVLHQRLVRFEADDGLDGYGLSELLEHP